MQHHGNNGGRPTSKITRKQAAEILRTSLKNVINLERRGKLTPFSDRSNIVRYLLAQVEALAVERGLPLVKAVTIKQIFAMFRAKLSLDIIVARTGWPPEEIGKLYQQHLGGLKLWAAQPRPTRAEEKLVSQQKRSVADTLREQKEARDRRIAALLAPRRPDGSKK